MNLAWNAADLFIARAGASTIAEAMEFEVPRHLDPLSLCTEPPGEERRLLGEDGRRGCEAVGAQSHCFTLCQQIYHIFSDGKWPLTQMREAMRRYKQRPSQDTLCSLVLRHLN